MLEKHMADLAHNPAFNTLIATLLALWPLARIYRRNGQSPALALLLFGSVVIPFLGYILCGAAFLLKKKAAA